MNMELKRVGASAKGSAMKRRGTKAHCMTKASPPLSSTKKNRALRAINAYVTSGKVLRSLLSSPIGNMTISPLHLDSAKALGIGEQGRAREAMEFYHKVLGGSLDLQASNAQGASRPALGIASVRLGSRSTARPSSCQAATPTTPPRAPRT